MTVIDSMITTYTTAVTVIASAILGKECLTEEKEILSRLTEYCSKLYNYENYGDNTVLDCSQHPEEDLQPILR